MAGPKLEPHEQRALDKQREDHRLKQPYATELDNRELEHAENEDHEQDGGIILGKLKAPRDVDAKRVDYPWYPADVREAAIDGLAKLFTSTHDNRLFPFTRYAPGHVMEFTLRPGEQLIAHYGRWRRAGRPLAADFAYRGRITSRPIRPAKG